MGRRESADTLPLPELLAPEAAATAAGRTEAMNEYQVTFVNGEVVRIEAWTPELAQAIAEEDAEQEGRSSLTVARVELLASQEVEL